MRKSFPWLAIPLALVLTALLHPIRWGWQKVRRVKHDESPRRWPWMLILISAGALLALLVAQVLAIRSAAAHSAPVGHGGPVWGALGMVVILLGITAGTAVHRRWWGGWQRGHFVITAAALVFLTWSMYRSNLGGMLGNLMGQVQQMQSNLAQVREKLREHTVEGQSGGGIVAVTAAGSGEIVRVQIDPVAVDPRDVPMLEDLIAAATNDALSRARELRRAEVTALTGGIPIPGLADLL